jgi:glycine/D-amino acid oxidase-like deaminating enzyme
MDRRTLLKTCALATLGFSADCSAWQRVASRRPPQPPAHFGPVHASWDRVVRTTVGLRPYRLSGFVLKAERLDAKTVIHNYGHGGAGMSLALGCGQVAADLAVATGKRRVAVIGCGAVGLASARHLHRRGFDVTIYAMSIPPDTTSNMSLAAFTPTSSVVARDRRTPQWDAQFRRVAAISYEELQLLIGERYGVGWLDNYGPMDDLPDVADATALLPRMPAAEIVLGPGQHPFPTRYAVKRRTLRIEPSVYLAAMLDDFLLSRGRILKRKFETPRDLMSLAEPVIVNCTGLGSRTLFGDNELVAEKGQLTTLIAQPEVDYMTIGSGLRVANVPSAGLYMMPRRDGIVLGGTRERDVWTLEPNDAERTRVVEGHRAFFGAMAQVARDGRGAIARA